MDALQVISNATQIITAMFGAISAIDQAAIKLAEAPRKIQTLEEFVANLESLMHQTKLRNLHKLHNPQLERKLQSLSSLIVRLRANVSKSQKVVTKNKAKGLAKLVWSSMVGDPLSKYIQLIRDDLNWWIELQNITDTVCKVITSTAQSQPSMLRVRSEKGYPVSKKCHLIRELLEREDTHWVILIVGLSGIGKSCLARQIASDPPGKFCDGAVEINFGRWCSRAACNWNISEYHNRLSKRIKRFLVQIGYGNRGREIGGDLEDLCLLLQTAMVGKSMLVLLDDVWEQDIVDRFVRLYDNECHYLVTTRDEAVFEITEAEKVEICKDDIKEISKEILLYHTLLSEEELPSVAEELLNRCGHHPLTVAVMGKALRKEKLDEKWEKAISNLSTYATCAPGPISYVNEKEATETTLTIFGSFEFSLEAMPENSRQFFILLSSLSWAEPVPESCLEALWSVLGAVGMFPLVICKLVEGSLLIKLEQQSLYHVHDMVSLYLDVKIESAVSTILVNASLENIAFIVPWLFIFGKESIQEMAREKIELFLVNHKDKKVVILLESMVQALMASKSISELETSRLGFSQILAPVMCELISSGSTELLIAAANSITTVFLPGDYAALAKSLEETNTISKLICLLKLCDESEILIVVSLAVAKLAEHFSAKTVDNILTYIPMDQLSELLSPETEEFHESIFTILLSLAKAGKLIAIETMFRSGIAKRLLVLLVEGSDLSQHNAIVTLKAFNELGARLDKGCFQPEEMNLLPWNARLSLERFFFSDSKVIIPSPKPQTFEIMLHKILDTDEKEVVEAIQGLIPIAEKANDPKTQDLILGSGLIERLGFLLKSGDIDQAQVRSESAFLIMKLACTGGEPFVQKYLQLDMICTLIKMMQCNITELQDSAYSALHHIVFAKGGSKVSTKLLQTGQIEKLVNSLDRKCIKTKEVVMLFLVDLVEIGSKPCIEKMICSQIVEKLVGLEKLGGELSGSVLRFMKGLDLCKNLSGAERMVMKNQVVRKVRAAARGHEIEGSLVASVESCLSDSRRGASSSRRKK